MAAKLFRAGDPTNRGAGESLGSLQDNAGKHRNWYDVINELGGKGVDTIDFTQRAFDDNGRVKVTKYDVLLGRSQPELQAEYERQRQASVRNSPANQQFARDNSGTSAVPAVGERLYEPQTTNAGDIQNLNTKESTRVEKVTPLLEELGRMDGGTVAIATRLSDKPTAAEVASVIGELTPEQTKTKQAAQSHDSRLKTEQTGRETATATAAANTMNANTSRIQAINSDRQAQAKINFENAQLKHNYDIAVFEQQARSREANLDRTLRKDLSILGLEDKRDQRQHDRERDERKDRQLMIMQLLGGLKSLGGAFTL